LKFSSFTRLRFNSLVIEELFFDIGNVLIGCLLKSRFLLFLVLANPELDTIKTNDEVEYTRKID